MIQEFYVGAARYTPTSQCTYAGGKGTLWALSVLRGGAWVYWCSAFVKGVRPTRTRVIDAMPVPAEATDDNV